jgi:DEPDC5 protein C-terminal region
VEVTRYTAKNAQRNTINTCFKYFFLSYCDKTNGFVRTVQTFEKFSDQYNWNKVDRIICGDEDREMREGMRFKRIMFAVIPPRFESDDAEKAYIGKFKRLLEYLEKLREKDESDRPLNIKIVSSADKKKAQHTVAGQQQGQQVFSTPGIAGSSMVRFYVQLRKGKSSNFEWFEVAVDSTFETTWTFRIMFHWLVASSGKIDTQVQLLQRRCTQYGLNLVPFPQQSVSRNVFWNPFRAPAIFTVRDTSKALLVDTTLLGIDFIHDGVFYTDARSIAECIQEDGKIEFDFGQRWSKQPAARQFVHRSGTLFVRIITDKKGWALVVAFSNYRCCTRDDSMKKQNHEAFQTLQHSLELLLDRPALPSPPSGTATASPETRSPRYNGD